MTTLTPDAPAQSAAGAATLSRRRPRGTAGAVLLFFLLALAVLWPYRYEHLNPTPLRDVIIPIAEAQRALDEGQFPIRVAPRQLHGSRYPLFQFYGNFPFTACGLVHHVFRITAYQAWKLVTLLTITCGGYFTFRCAYQFTRHAAASVVAGVLFVTAPYVLSDLYQRSAYSEFTALNLLPAALYFSLRCFSTRRLRYVALCALAWALVGLSHNITYLYGVTFAGLYFLSHGLTFRRRAALKYLRRMTRLAMAGLLHAGLILWYVAPQFAVLNDLMMHERTDSPFPTAADFSPLHALLAPRPVAMPNPALAPLGVQVGWPILGLAALAVLGAVARRRGRRVWPTAARLAALFLVALLLAWSPVDFWRFLPSPYQFVQFTYRLVLFTALFGSLLGGVALATWLPRRRAAAAAVTVAALVLAGYATRPYLPRDRRVDPNDFARFAEQPDRFIGLEDYQVSTAAAAKTSWFHRDLNLAGWQYGLLYGDLHDRENVSVPAPRHASGLLVEGTVLPPGSWVPPEQLEASRLRVTVAGRTETVPLTHEPATFRLAVPIDPAQRLGRRTPVTAALDGPAGPLEWRAVRLTAVRWESPAPGRLDDRALLAAEDVAPRVAFGRETTYHLATDRPALLQLPVLYYPGLLDVRNHGRPIPYGNVGRFVAVDLPPGGHKITVRFAGVRWANVVSLIAWVVVLLAGVVARLKRQRGRYRRAAAPALGFVPGALYAAAVVLGAAGGALAGRALEALTSGPRVDVVAGASSESRPDLAAGNAVDGDPDSAWSAQGGGPARLVLVPERAATLERVALDARGDALLEAWHRVRVVLSLKGQTVFEQEFSFPDAATVRAHEVALPPTRTDRIELHFSEPVLRTVDGRAIPPGAVNPGYREVRLQWSHE